MGESRRQIEYKPLVIGDLVVEKPVIQGGMGVGISLSSLAGAVAKAGGAGIISAAQIGFQEPDFEANQLEANLRAIGKEMEKARKIAQGGVIGFNIMVATKEYERYVKAAVKAGADLIISGAGLPVTLPGCVMEAEREMTAERGMVAGCETTAERGMAAGCGTKAERGMAHRTKLAPIVSTVKAASVICKMWDRKYHIAPDLVVVEGPLAGGHLGFSRDQLADLGADTANIDETFKRADYDEEVKNIIKLVQEVGRNYGKKIPVVTAGGIYTHEDVLHQMELGADGVQVATRFVTTEECDAPDGYKQAYIKAKKEDIVITKSPVGMPGRAIFNSFLESIRKERRPPKHCLNCLEQCSPKTAPYCITEALVRAAKGDMDDALIFCGTNAYRAKRIETVAEVMADLLGHF